MSVQSLTHTMLGICTDLALVQMTKRTRITHFVSPNNLAGSTVRSYSTTEGTRKVCTGGIPVTYDYDISQGTLAL